MHTRDWHTLQCHGQKGIIGMMYSQQDVMAEANTPDIIVNHMLYRRE